MPPATDRIRHDDRSSKQEEFAASGKLSEQANKILNQESLAGTARIQKQDDVSANIDSASRHLPNLQLSNSDTSRHTLGGKLIGELHDLISAKPKSQAEAAERAHADDQVAEVVGDVASMLPLQGKLLGAGVRALLLAKPEEFVSSPGQALLHLGKNFVEGVALHGLGQLGMAGASLGEMAQMGRMGLMGLGVGMIKSADDANWQERDGSISVSSATRGLLHVAEGGAIGALSSATGGYLAKTVGAQIASRIVNTSMPSRLSTMITLSGSGYASGFTTSAIGSEMKGNDLGEVLADANRGGLIGAAWGGATGAFVRVARTPNEAVQAADETKQSYTGDGSRTFGITNRLRSADGGLLSPEAGVSDKLNYYRLNDDGSFRFLSSERFFNSVAADSRRSGGVLAYVPGIMQAPGEAPRDLASVNTSLTKVAFDWGSTDKTSELHMWNALSKVQSDFEAARNSQGWIGDSLKDVLERIGEGGKKVLLAHSQGSPIAFEAARSMHDRGLDDVIFAHPHGVDGDQLHALGDVARQVTVIHNPDDKALALAQILDGRSTFLGRFGLSPGSGAAPTFLRLYNIKGLGPFGHSPDFPFISKII